MPTFTPLVIACLFHFVLWLGYSFVSSLIFRNRRSKAYYFFLVSLSVMGFAAGTLAMGFFYLEADWVRIAVLLMSISIFAGIAFLSYIKDDTFNVWRTAIGSVSICVCLILMWRPESVQIMEWQSYTIPVWTGIFQIFVIANGSIVALFGCEFLILTWRRARIFLPRYAKLILFGAIMIGPPLVGTYFTLGFFWTLLLVGFGFIIIGIIGLYQPKLLFLLAIDIQRIIIIDQKMGNTLYAKSWTTPGPDDALLGGLLKGFLDMSESLLAGGTIQEIKLDQGILVLQKTPDLFFGVLTSNPSNYLKNCFVKFSKIFQIFYEKMSPEYRQDIQNNPEVTKLLKDYFIILE